ncbi:MAG: hypothetical protein ACRDFB_06950, partial [Rhabdochlamydiaceae bacterium]
MNDEKNFFEKLIVAHKLAFAPGNITLLNHRVLMTSALFFSEYSMRVNDDPQRFRELYEVAKATYRAGSAMDIGKHEATSRYDMLQWMVNTASLSGWGKI